MEPQPSQPTNPKEQTPVNSSYGKQPVAPPPVFPRQTPDSRPPSRKNPFTGSIDRKAFLIWNIALTVVYYLINFSVGSGKAIVVYYVVAVILGLLLAVRRLQNTGLNMLLLLALLLPIANIIFLISLFFIPPRKISPSPNGSNAATPNTQPASRGFKIAMGIVLGIFLLIVIAVLVGLSH